ncbi:MAG: indole-3-glycerol phosphate synthase TrpC [Thermodesulfobacteriota bacterium]
MGKDILQQIVAKKRRQVEAAKTELPETVLRKAAENRTDFRSFAAPFAAGAADGRVNIIAEIKRASPSKGTIRENLDAGALAASYERGGAAALSVLTDLPYFKGSIEDLKTARSATALPVLRKDFILSSYQVYESAVIRADAVLLIVRVLSESQLKDYLDLCGVLHLDALVEVHDEADLETATKVGARLIGINNRNLASFDTDIGRAMAMTARLGPDQIPVAASGITSPADIAANCKAGISNFLVGESLVRAADPEQMLKSMING